MKINIKDEIRKLILLQEIDSKIYVFKQKKDVDNPVLLKKIKSEDEEKKAALEAFEDSVKQTLLKKKEKELDLTSKEETISKAQAQLYQLKTNKEYQAKLSEIGSLKADVSVLEEEIIKILDEIEEVEAKLKNEREKVARHQKESKEKEEKILSEQKEIEVEIKVLEDKRNKISKEVDKTILFKYERLISSRSGLALAAVRSESCGACFLRTSHQKINEIKMYKELIFCENCVRILYIPEDIER
ncbi:MAG: hypothetical protein JSV34_04355 [Candidatus Omnitrophota bacterium]|nr:MAG: hypothetical protein JSV34_04355 [Candidatus Omnitrophota bacterium]